MLYCSARRLGNAKAPTKPSYLLLTVRLCIYLYLGRVDKVTVLTFLLFVLIDYKGNSCEAPKRNVLANHNSLLYVSSGGFTATTPPGWVQFVLRV